jgi:hypothetical protein
MEVKISRGKIAIIDDDDYERINKHRWCYWASGGYAGRKVTNNKVGSIALMHREIMNAQKGQEIDHINGNGLDNRKSNLRFVTRQQNMWNRKALNKTSSYKGVSFDVSSGKWLSQINIQGQKICLGRYIVQEDAAKAYDITAKQAFGEYARLNGV